jgi:hypothetical protein
MSLDDLVEGIAAIDERLELPGSRQLREQPQVIGGTKPNLAKLTLARTIAATFLSMWKHEEIYDPARHRAS